MANAVLDGVDGLLLGAETLRGEYPVEVGARQLPAPCMCMMCLLWPCHVHASSRYTCLLWPLPRQQGAPAAVTFAHACLPVPADCGDGAEAGGSG